MSEPTMHRFFHSFWEQFVAHFKDLWMNFPKIAAEAGHSVEMHEELDFMEQWVPLIARMCSVG